VYAYLSYFGYKAGQATMTGFWNEMKKLGKEPNPYHAGFLQFVGVAETQEEAYRLYREPAEYFLRPLPACRRAFCRSAGLYERGDTARRRDQPGRAGGVQAPDAGA